MNHSPTTALLCVAGQRGAPGLAADLHAAGVQVLATVHDTTKLVHDVAVHAPSVLVCDLPVPGAAWFKALGLLDQTVPTPVLLFTSDTDAASMHKALACGVHAYVVNGYGSARLRGLVQLVQARCAQVQSQRKAYDDLATRFEERKVVDRAKGILMEQQQLSDEDAFRVLRSGAMRTNQRLGQLSRHVIQSAQLAEALNRAGQLRMLSQRLVKLYLLQAAHVPSALHAEQLQSSLQRVADNFNYLESTLSQPGYADLLAPLMQTWKQLQAALHQALAQSAEAAAKADAGARIDRLAEDLLQGAERLSASLEGASPLPPLQLLNVAGRQRMLSQRFAKCTLLALGEPAPGHALADCAAAQAEFERALTFLNGLPLSSQAIQDSLRDAGVAWLQMLAAARTLPGSSGEQRAHGLHTLALGSEDLLQRFETLAALYAHSLDMLLG